MQSGDLMDREREMQTQALRPPSHVTRHITQEIQLETAHRDDSERSENECCKVHVCCSGCVHARCASRKNGKFEFGGHVR